MVVELDYPIKLKGGELRRGGGNLHCCDNLCNLSPQMCDNHELEHLKANLQMKRLLVASFNIISHMSPRRVFEEHEQEEITKFMSSS